MKKSSFLLACVLMPPFFIAASEDLPTHRRSSKLEIVTHGTKRTLTINTVSTTMVNGELVRCKMCGSHEVTESITIDDSTYGFCDTHKGSAPSNWTSLPGVPEGEEKKEKAALQ